MKSTEQYLKPHIFGYIDSGCCVHPGKPPNLHLVLIIRYHRPGAQVKIIYEDDAMGPGKKRIAPKEKYRTIFGRWTITFAPFYRIQKFFYLYKLQDIIYLLNNSQLSNIFP